MMPKALDTTLNVFKHVNDLFLVCLVVLFAPLLVVIDFNHHGTVNGQELAQVLLHFFKCLETADFVQVGDHICRSSFIFSYSFCQK